MRVFIVELREQHPDNVIQDCVDMHVASTEEKAFRWAVKNASLLTGGVAEASVFAICSDVVDSDSVATTTLLGWVGRDGEIAREELPEYVQQAMADAHEYTQAEAYDRYRVS
jgi:hypothetical protein